MGFTEALARAKLAEQTDDCYDIRTHEAWVSHKNGESRCFFEHREYPHRVKATYIDKAIN